MQAGCWRGVSEFVGNIPSSAHLADYEAQSEPAVYRGGASTWPALSLWTGPEGVQYLTSQHGESVVDVAVSSNATFSGDIRHARSVSVPFKAFLQGKIFEPGDDEGTCRGEFCKDVASAGGVEINSGETDGMGGTVCYLAQCPLFSQCEEASGSPVNEPVCQAACPKAQGSLPAVPADFGTSRPLHKLANDIVVPDALGGCSEGFQSLCSVNLWMCGKARERLTSTLHYDGHNNILVCISGSKTVTLFPPDHRGCLAALQPVFAPSSNHCRQLEKATKPSWNGGKAVVIKPGDCLFIPEGWFHQVTSEPHTIAVNMWWPGAGWLAVGAGDGLGTACCLTASTNLGLMRERERTRLLYERVEGGKLERTVGQEESMRARARGAALGAERRRGYLARRLVEGDKEACRRKACTRIAWREGEGAGV